MNCEVRGKFALHHRSRSWISSLGRGTVVCVLGLLAWGDSRARAAIECDVLLKNGTVHVGDGSPPQIADVAIRDGRIVDMGTELQAKAGLTLECRGLVVSPGFIDLHTHSDEEILARDTRANINYLLQGCTTIVTGNCGGGHLDTGKYLDEVDREHAGTNVAHLLPHGRLRTEVMGREDREPTSEELNEMKKLAAAAMRDGAVGMSTGLIYVPGTFAETEELIAIAKVVAEHGGIYVSHIRGEGTSLMKSVDEAIRIGTQANLPTHISHFKASGKKAWGSLHIAAKIIEEARRQGKIVTADQYPYTASSTSLEATLLPTWARAGGRTALTKRLADPSDTEKIRKDLIEAMETIHRIQIANYRARPDWIGKSLDDIAKQESMDVIDVVLTIERNGGAQIVNFGMNEEDVRMAMKFPWVATASDGSAQMVSSLMPHPRSYGTFPRKVGHYAIRDQVIPLEAAIRSCASLPATIIGLQDRGTVKKDYIADLVVFDPNAFVDQATFDRPHLPASGMRHVLIGGKLAVYEGSPTGALLGKSIRNNKVAGAKTK